MVPKEKPEDQTKSEEFILLSTINIGTTFQGSHPVVVEIFQSDGELTDLTDSSVALNRKAVNSHI